MSEGAMKNVFDSRTPLCSGYQGNSWVTIAISTVLGGTRFGVTGRRRDMGHPRSSRISKRTFSMSSSCLGCFLPVQQPMMFLDDPAHLRSPGVQHTRVVEMLSLAKHCRTDDVQYPIPFPWATQLRSCYFQAEARMRLNESSVYPLMYKIEAGSVHERTPIIA